MLQPFDLDHRAVARQFDRRANTFEECDFLLREVEARMLSRLEVVKVAPASILDLGCGLGAGVLALARRFPEARVEGVDNSPRMVERARKSLALPPDGVFSRLMKSLSAKRVLSPQFRVADLHHLPVDSDSVDLLWSNLVLHWLASPEPALAQIYRVARPGSLFMFSAFGVDTLREIKPARQATSQSGGLMAFRDMHDWGDALVECGFAEPVMDMEHIELSYSDPDRLLADLRLIGGNALAGRRQGLCAPALKADVLMALGRIPKKNGKFVLTFEVVYGHAWVPSRKKRADGLATIDFLPQRRLHGSGS